MARIFQTLIASIIVGVCGGLSASVLLYSLNWATAYRDQHFTIVWLLPLAGLFIGFMYHKFGKESAGGTHLIIDEIHKNQKKVPLRMAPMIYFGTVLTHLFGGSAGREGTAVQMSVALADRLIHLLKFQRFERKRLLVAAVSAGFGAAVGAPIAGAVFGMEMSTVGRWDREAWVESFIASFVGYGVVSALQTPHSSFQQVEVGSINLEMIGGIIVAGIVFSIAAKVFIQSVHLSENLFSKVIKQNFFRPFLGGIIILGFYSYVGFDPYMGLGLQEIQKALLTMSTFEIPLNKFFATVLTLGSGFKGGEFIPLVFLGSTLGSALAILLPVSVRLLSALGFVSVFAGASNTPIACSILAAEIFGWRIFPFALLTCYISYFFSGKKSIYKTQKNLQKKFSMNLFKFII